MARRSESQARILERPGAASPAPEADTGAPAAGERTAPTAALAGVSAGDGLFTGEAQENGPRVDGRINPELAALLEEAEGPAEPPAPAPIALDQAQFTRILTPAVDGLTGIGCRWARVTPLEGEEVAMLTGSLYELASAFDLLGQLDPRTAALLNFGMVACAIAMKRERLPRQSSAPEAPAQDPATVYPREIPDPPASAPKPAHPLAHLNDGFK
jgi:hypothetical protein